MKKPTFKRVIAFIIDMVIVSIIASALSSIKYINPDIEKYNDAYTEYVKYLENDLDISEASNVINSETYQKYTYDLSYYGRYSTLMTCIVSFLYFVVFQYCTKGYTGGKKLLGIKVDTMKGKLKFHNVLLRSLIVNSLITNILALLAVFLLKEAAFMKVSMFIEVLDIGLLFTSFGMVLIREDGRGLHDLIAGTKVVSDVKIKE